MKLVKKVAAALMSLLMVLLMIPTNALASSITDSTTGTLNITKEGSASTFAVYRLFDMSVAAGADAFTYTANAKFSSFFSAAGAPTAKDISGYDANQLKKFTADLRSYISGPDHLVGTTDDAVPATATETAVKTSGDTYTATFNDIAIGYYLVVETATTGARVASKDFLVSVPTGTTTGGVTNWNYNVTAKCKDSTVTFDKTIMKDDKDVDRVTQNIGDTIQYRLVADVPKYDPSAKDITFDISDIMSKGLTFETNSVEIVGIDGSGSDTTLTPSTDYTATSAKNGKGETIISIRFVYDNIKSYNSVRVYYRATLNQDAVIGSAGNPNEAYLIYTNNPDTKTTHETEHPRTYVYTFGIAIEKEDAANPQTKLSGAEFALLDSTGTKKLAVYTYDASGKVVIINSPNTSVVTGPDGMVYFLGVKEGTYFIQELKAPAGYSILPGKIKVVITAVMGSDHQPTGDFTCTYSLNDGEAKETSYTYADSPANTLKILAKFQIQNDQGFILPGTGGIGTTIFTVTGIAIILVGCFMASYLYLRKRRNSQH
ncbi:MAG TPA: SpaH/EbpB family LPXTG-anchored major pilin [Clostridiales bacterium]|nr:SpaH/EbpB family LPXTG-anchored major pilin [Clostridiales bacterium]